jgi:hypothetical protein
MRLKAILTWVIGKSYCVIQVITLKKNYTSVQIEFKFNERLKYTLLLLNCANACV